jgi:hypothetical protein
MALPLSRTEIPPAAPRRAFTVAPNAQGRWVVRDRDGLVERVFADQRDAIRFALTQACDRGTAVLMSPSQIAS